jgi:pyruvate dehydrogenase E2 component (dihydrolipoamide acetyltransferase)
MTTFTLPDIGEGLQEAEIVTWHVAVGDHVVADQPLVSVETDKAVVEIPSPQSGHVAALHGEGEHLDVGAIVGDLPNGDVAAAQAVPAAAPVVVRRPRGPRCTPLVRRLAKRLGVDLTDVQPSGPGGSVTRADVEAVAAGRPAAGRPAIGDARVEPLRGVRRAMDANMSRAHAEVVPASVTEEADITDWPPGTDTTVRLVRAVARACEAEPALNAAYLGRDEGRRLHDHVDIGIAVDTDDGLFVPVLRDVSRRAADDLRRGLDAMRADVTARRVAPEHPGRARDTVAPHAGGIAVRRHLPLSLTFDHRVVMGGEATRFLIALRADLEETT